MNLGVSFIDQEMETTRFKGLGFRVQGLGFRGYMSKLWVPFWGPYSKDYSIFGVYFWGPLNLGNYQIKKWKPLCRVSGFRTWGQ